MSTRCFFVIEIDRRETIMYCRRFFSPSDTLVYTAVVTKPLSRLYFVPAQIIVHRQQDLFIRREDFSRLNNTISSFVVKSGIYNETTAVTFMFSIFYIFCVSINVDAFFSRYDSHLYRNII